MLGHALQKKSGTPSTSSTSVLAPITVAAPPDNPAADAPCTKLLGALPVSLNGMPARPARSSWTYVVAWGNPPIVLRCGVPRPAALTPGSSAQTIGVDGVFWLPVVQKKHTLWTAIDRAAYVEVSVPESYAQPPLAPISDAISSTMPAVCVVDPAVTETNRLCTHRP